MNTTIRTSETQLASRFRRIWYILAGFLLPAILSAEPARVTIQSAANAQGLEKLACEELSAYFEKIFTNPIAVGPDAGTPPGYAILLGTVQSHARIAELLKVGTLALPDGKNADQGYCLKTVDDRTLAIAGASPAGALYGVYAFLEHCGVMFQINGERLPAKKLFTPGQFDEKNAPVFKYRGLLPWDNFLCGISGYDLADYQTLIARATRMRFNLLQFHFYPGMAFFTEQWDGKPVNPSVIGMPVDVFRTKGAVGSNAFGNEAIFGCDPYVTNIGKPRVQAEQVQAMMREVIDYAHSRGIKTCVGFELMHSVGGVFSMTDKPADGNGGANFNNPLDGNNVAQSVERLRTLMKTYPNSDFYWMWQSEARGYLARNVGREPGAAEMRKKCAHWAGDPNRAGDIDYAYLFREVANRLSPAERSRLSTGGWSIEHLFPGMNADFPAELIFASLNSYIPPDASKNQVPSYRVAQNGRRAWMIDWWEFDGIQWFPQFRAAWQEQMYRQCVDYGVEAVTLLGWKLSGIEHNVRYLSEFSWNPKLAAADFYKDYCRRLYGQSAGPVAPLYETYNRIETEIPCAAPGGPPMFFAAGWASTSPPPYPNKAEGLDAPVWRNRIAAIPTHVRDLQKLQDTDKTSIKALAELLPTLDPLGQSCVQLMANRLEVRCHYIDAFLALDESESVYDRVARDKGIDAARKAAAEPAGQAVDRARQAIECYAREIRDTGDKGVVAQMNEQFYKVLLGSRRSLLGESPYIRVDWTAFRLHAKRTFDFTTNPWGARDGKVEMSLKTDEGRPVLSLALGGDGGPYHSVWVLPPGPVNLEESPWLDMTLRAASDQPLALMFQLDTTGDAWHALNLVGRQSAYNDADGLPAGGLGDGQWHRLTWNLKQLVEEKLNGGAMIHNLILGTWESPAKPVQVDFRSFSLGTRNTLD